MTKLPLDGIRVATFEIMWAAPMTTQILGDLGAEVIRVENIYNFQSGVTSRGFTITKEQNKFMQPWVGAYPDRDPGEKPFNQCPFFVHNLRNKYSMTLDIRRPEGWAIFEKLVKICDVIVENNVAETAEKLGLTYERLKAIKNDIILVRMPAYGIEGPYANRRAWGAHMEDLSGHNMLRAYRDMGPTGNGQVFAADYMGGSLGALATMMALRHKRRTGKGQMIEVAQVEGAMLCLGEAIMDYSMNKRDAVSVGNRDIHGGAPYGTYRCKGEDRWVNICVTSEDEWQGLCEVMGNPEWTQKAEFATAFSRNKNQDELDKCVESWTINHDNYAVMQMLQNNNVPAGPVLDGKDFFYDPQWQDRDWFEEVTHPLAGKRLWPGVMAKFSRTPIHIRKSHVMLGEDNEYVYKQLIGVSDEEYHDLEKKAHIGTDYVYEFKAAEGTRLTIDSKLGELLADEKAKAILEKHIPGISEHPQLKMGLGMPFKTIAGMAKDMIGEDKLKAIEKDLKTL